MLYKKKTKFANMIGRKIYNMAFLMNDTKWDFMLKLKNVTLYNLPRFDLFFCKLKSKNNVEASVNFSNLMFRLFLQYPRIFYFKISKHSLFKQTRRLGFRKVKIRKSKALIKIIFYYKRLMKSNNIIKWDKFYFLSLFYFLVFWLFPKDKFLVLPFKKIRNRNMFKIKFFELTNFLMFKLYEDEDDGQWSFSPALFIKISGHAKFKKLYMSLFKLFPYNHEFSKINRVKSLRKFVF